MKLSQRIMFAKTFATGLAFLSFAALAADKSVWNSPSGTEWSVGVWAKGTSENGYWFNNAEGASTVLNNDILVTFADAYTIPYNLKFENNNNGNGVVRFLADDDSKGLSVTGQLQLGWGNDRGSLWLERGSYYATDKLYFRGGELTIDNGASLSVTNASEISTNGGNGRDATLDILGGSFSVLNGDLYVGYCDNRTGSVVMTNGNVDVRYQLQVAKSNNSTGIFAISNGTVNCGSLFQVGLYGHGEFYMEDGLVNCGESFRMATDRAEATATGVMNGGRITTTKTGDEYGIMIGNQGVATFTMNGGEISPADEFILGRRGHGTFVMNGGTITTTTSGEVWIGGSTNDNNNKGTGVFVMNDGLVDLHNWMSVGRTGTGRLELYGGTFQVVNNGVEIARYGNSTGTVVVAGGTLDYRGNQYLAVGFEGDYGELIVSNGLANSTREVHIAKGSGKEGRVFVEGGRLNTSTHVYVGHTGTGSFYMNGGEVYIGDQFWLGNGGSSYGLFVMTNGEMTVDKYTCVGYGSGNGKFIMNGGSYYQNSEKFIIGQGGSDTAYGECIVSNGTINVPNLWVAEKATPGMLTMEGGEFISRGETQMSRNTNAGKGTIILNGGTLSVFRFVGSSGTGGEVIFNGGTLKALDNSGDFIPDIANCEFKIAAGGAVFDTNGKNVTVADTLDNAAGLVGNGTIAKKGLGTLTISSNLDLERTFKFTIDTDLGAAGVGTIALDGGTYTLDTANSKKITVEIDPVNAETNVAYTVMTGLGAVTMGDIVLTGTDFYTYTGEVTDGTLSVTLQYGPTAPVTARYDNGAWGVYNSNNELIPNGTATNLTTYVFNGSEPAGDFATYAAVHKILLESGTIAIDSAVEAGHVAVAAGATVTISGSDLASFAAERVVNNGTIVFAGEVTLSGTVDYPFSIAEDARVTLVTPQAIAASISGAGTLALAGGAYSGLSSTRMSGFSGVLELCAGVTLSPTMENQHFEPGTGHVRMAGATLYGGNDTGIYFDMPFEIVGGTENVVWGENANLGIGRALTGAGTLEVYTSNNRGPYLSGDNRAFAGVLIMHGTTIAPPTGFNGNNSGSSNAVWRLTQDSFVGRDGDMTYTLFDQDVNGDAICFGVLQQTGPNAYIRAGSTKQYRNGMKVEVGALPGGESVIEGRFSVSSVNLKKVGSDSWLTLGTNFNMVAGSTVNIAEGGLGFNLPEGETVAALTNATVSISPSVRARVSMTAAQYAALDTAQTYTLAKLASSPGVSKLATVLSVDGEVPHDRNADKWRVCFKFVGATAQEDAHYEAVLGYFAPGFVIIVQ